MNEQAAETGGFFGQRAGGFGVDGPGEIRLGFGLVDRRVGCRIDDQRRTYGADSRANRRRARKVNVS